MQTCEFCGAGKYITEAHRDKTACEACPSSQIALKSLEWLSFTNPLNSDYLKLECISTDLDTVSDDCLHLRGFKVVNGTLTTGPSVPGGVVLSLTTA